MSLLLRIAVAAIVACLLWPVPPAFSDAPPAQAKSQPDSEWRFHDADWVSQLRIEGVGSLVVPAMSRAHLSVVQGYRYSASVVRQWKGEQGETIRFRVDLSDCREMLQVGGEYLVFGTVDYRGELQSRRCDDMVPVAAAGHLLAKLNALDKGHRLAGQSGS